MKTKVLFPSLLLFHLICLPLALAAPGYPVLDKKPPPGDSGVHYDKENNRIHTYYGDKDLRQHMEHLMYNQRKHPENKGPFEVGKPGDNRNRKSALAGTKPKPGFARDEKPPNSMKHDGTKVTMRHLPKAESDREMKLLSTTTAKARNTKAQVQFHANPGPDYKGRGAKSLSRPRGSSSARPPSVKPPWNAGPGLQRSSSAPPRGRSPVRVVTPPASRSKSAPASSRPPISSKAQGKQPVRNASPPSRGRSPARNASPGPSQSRGRSTTPKPAWNAGPGARRNQSPQPPRRSERLAKSKPQPQAKGKM